MSGHWEITAMCLHADTPLDCPEFRERVITRHRAKAMRMNRAVWADNHYRKTGHHRFEYGDTEVSEVSVAHLPLDPNQLQLSDDPNYETFKL